MQSTPIATKRNLYVTLIRSKLTYCSQLWRPRLLKDIIMLETVQKRSTKFILQDYTSDYKSRLIQLNLLPLMYWYDLQGPTLSYQMHEKPSGQHQPSTRIYILYIYKHP